MDIQRSPTSPLSFIHRRFMAVQSMVDLSMHSAPWKFRRSRNIIPWTPSAWNFRPRSVGFVTACIIVLMLLGGSSPLAAQPSAPTAEREFTQALRLYEQHLYRKSASAFRSFRNRFPDHPSTPQALFFEAQSALAGGRENEAIRLFETLQSEYPAHPRAQEAQLSVGQYFVDQGNPDRGREILERIVRENPEGPNAAQAVYQMGALERDRGNLDLAISYFERVLRDYPQSEVAPAAAYDVAATHVRLEAFEDAARSFERLAQQYPASPYAKNTGTAVAEVYYELDRYDRVIEEIRPNLSTFTSDERPRALFFLAEAYNQREDTENAIVFYRQIIDEAPESAYLRPAHYGMGWNYLRSDAFSDAANSFAQVRAAAVGSERQDALSMKATYYEAVARERAGRLDRAERLFQSVVDDWPEAPFAPAAQHEVGILQFKASNHDAAAASFREVIRSDASADLLGDAYYMLGNAYTASGDLNRALDAYDQAIRRGSAPDSLRREVEFQKAWTLYENGRYDEAQTGFLRLAREGTGQRSRDALFWGGDCLFQTGRYERAASRFEQYLDRYPDGHHASAAYYTLGWTRFRMRQYEPAVSAFRSFLDRYSETNTKIPYRQDARLRLADSYYALKRYDEAVTEYRRVEGQGADYALYQTGEALSRAGRNTEAIRTLRGLVSAYPDSPWQNQAQFRIGFIHFQNREYEDARAAYRQLIQGNPTGDLAARAQYGIGDTYYNAGDMDRAVSEYRTVLERYPQSPYASEAASSLQYALLATGEPERATEIINDFAEANPGSPMIDELRFRQAEATYQSGDVGRALQLFQRFVRTSNNEALLPQAYFYLGEIYADREQTAEARTYLQQLVDRYPSSDRRPEAALRLGDLSLDQDRPQEALDAYRVVSGDEDVNPELRAQAVYGESVALRALGRRPEAQDLLQRLIDENRGGPLLASARLGLARIYDDDGRTDEAESLYRTVANNSDGETGAEALVRLGALMRQDGRPQQAVQELDRTSALFPGYPEWIARSLLEQARAHRQMGRTGEASRIYDQVVEEYGGTRFAERAQSERQQL